MRRAAANYVVENIDEATRAVGETPYREFPTLANVRNTLYGLMGLRLGRNPTTNPSILAKPEIAGSFWVAMLNPMPRNASSTALISRGAGFSLMYVRP